MERVVIWAEVDLHYSDTEFNGAARRFTAILELPRSEAPQLRRHDLWHAPRAAAWELPTLDRALQIPAAEGRKPQPCETHTA